MHATIGTSEMRPAGVKRRQTLLSSCQVHADALFVVPHIHPPIGKGGHAPDDGATVRHTGWLDYFLPIDFFVTVWSEFPNYDFSLIVE